MAMQSKMTGKWGRNPRDIFAARGSADALERGLRPLHPRQGLRPWDPSSPLLRDSRPNWQEFHIHARLQFTCEPRARVVECWVSPTASPNIPRPRFTAYSGAKIYAQSPATRRGALTGSRSTFKTRGPLAKPLHKPSGSAGAAPEGKRVSSVRVHHEYREKTR